VTNFSFLLVQVGWLPFDPCLVVTSSWWLYYCFQPVTRYLFVGRFVVARPGPDFLSSSVGSLRARQLVLAWCASRLGSRIRVS
jgi:hypothetical protein